MYFFLPFATPHSIFWGYMIGALLQDACGRQDDRFLSHVLPCQAAFLGTCVQVPVQNCGKLLGPCAWEPYGSRQGPDVTIGDADTFCPNKTTCPMG